MKPQDYNAAPESWFLSGRGRALATDRRLARTADAPRVRSALPRPSRVDYRSAFPRLTRWEPGRFALRSNRLPDASLD
jgi:hypothetical protein